MKDPENNQQKEHLDDDILEGKNDVLRAKDIIPAAPVPIQLDDSPAQLPLSEESLPEQKDTGIPQLDLDEKIMTRQRKISAVRRRSPAKNDKPQEHKKPREKSYIFNQSTLTTTQENRLISQIVARDIKKLSQEK
ncbi:MAG: hypothetical protein ACYSSP_07750 [Planctomycetota bacterium]|jgi:hypothetical protein